jgi:hypothetical protein
MLVFDALQVSTKLAVTELLSTVHRLPKMDQQLSLALEPIRDIAATVEMPFVCFLKDEEAVKRQAYPGVYRIDVQTSGTETELAAWIAKFRSEWEHADFKKSFTPNLKKKRIAGHTTLPEWMPLYLGKSKNVGKRVLEHIKLPLNKTTFALKLNARPGMAERTLRLHTLELRVQNYDAIVPALESALRNRFHPLIGKQ